MGSAPSGSSAGSPGSTPGPVAEIHYALTPVMIVEPDYNGEIAGMLSTPDGGYKIIWITAAFTTDMQVQKSWFQQLFDSAGRPVGSKTPIAPPTSDMVSQLTASMQRGELEALDGGYFVGTSEFRKTGLHLQHYSADGTAIDPPIDMGVGIEGFYLARLYLPDGVIALAYQNVSTARLGPIHAALLAPAPR